jgi:hypothetical protein
VSALETPVDFIAREQPLARGTGALVLLNLIRARDEQIAAWCEENATDAQREAEKHQHAAELAMMVDDAGGASAHVLAAERCEGQASAFRVIASALRGHAPQIDRAGAHDR